MEWRLAAMSAASFASNLIAAFGSYPPRAFAGGVLPQRQPVECWAGFVGAGQKILFFDGRHFIAALFRLSLFSVPPISFSVRCCCNPVPAGALFRPHSGAAIYPGVCYWKKAEHLNNNLFCVIGSYL